MALLRPNDPTIDGALRVGSKLGFFLLLSLSLASATSPGTTLYKDYRRKDRSVCGLAPESNTRRERNLVSVRTKDSSPIRLPRRFSSHTHARQRLIEYEIAECLRYNGKVPALLSLLEEIRVHARTRGRMTALHNYGMAIVFAILGNTMECRRRPCQYGQHSIEIRIVDGHGHTFVSLDWVNTF